MPIFMDRHDVSAEVTAEIVAQLHREDLKIQDKFNCRGITYWFDDSRKTAFCLVEAPNKQAIQEMHNHAHGKVANRIIEVDGAVVESFLGRIEDPAKSENTDLNIINDPAFRTIMVLTIKPLRLSNSINTQRPDYQKHLDFIQSSVNSFKGRIVKHRSQYCLAVFDSVSQAVQCALEIQKSTANQQNHWIINMGLSAGVPVTEKDGIFEDTIKMAERLSEYINNRISVSSEVKDLYESENQNMVFESYNIYVLSSADEKFLNQLIDYTESIWHQPNISAGDYCTNLGYSKSQLYRKMMAVIEKSPNTFINEYRLSQALFFLKQQTDNVSEVAFKSGFNSAGYFSRCFKDRYGMLPSQYLQQLKP